jgi:hypothetical protein
MDTNTLLTDIKARFAHNSAKAYLKEKYESKLIVADQGGLWKANLETLTALSVPFAKTEMILIDTFGNPVKVNRVKLLETLGAVYDTVMEEWHKEWQELEAKR